MVSAHLVDTIRDPSRFIIDLYDEGRGTEPDFPARVTSHFATVFHTQDSIQQVRARCTRTSPRLGTHVSTKIPSLSLDNPPDVHLNRSLVRFRAMIQDIPSPEMYLSRLPGGRCGGWNLYQDLTAPSSVDIDFHDLQECSVFWAITVPGESRWYAERLGGPLFNKGPTYRLSSPSRFN
jgi:hypothetical protein